MDSEKQIQIKTILSTPTTTTLFSPCFTPSATKCLVVPEPSPSSTSALLRIQVCPQDQITQLSALPTHYQREKSRERKRTVQLWASCWPAMWVQQPQPQISSNAFTQRQDGVGTTHGSHLPSFEIEVKLSSLFSDTILNHLVTSCGVLVGIASYCV